METALKVYKARSGIEAMLKDCKSGGDNLEDSKASRGDKPLRSLMNQAFHPLEVQIWFPLIKCILSTQIAAGSRVIVTIDRTQWLANNLLMVSVIWQKRAFPVYWQFLEKAGSSNLNEQFDRACLYLCWIARSIH